MDLLSYNEVRELIGAGRSHLLLGNGFSISCDPVFKYQSLYEYAVTAGLSQIAQSIFEKLGTNNFEGVMRLLDDAHWAALTYGLIEDGESQMLKDKEVIKKALIEAVAETHLDDTTAVPNDKKDATLKFLTNFHNIFTTNYDLLLYWVIMHKGTPIFQDGFRDDPDDSDSLIFSHRMGGASKGIYYLHGALHLFYEGGEYRKHSWVKSGSKLTDLIRDGLKAEHYPLFVAEGDPDKKLQQIQHSGYLWYCLDKLARIEGPLVIFGHSLGPSDMHIIERMVGNIKLEKIFIGLHGDPESPNNLSIRAAASAMILKRAAIPKSASLSIQYFDTATTNVWGES